MFGISRGNLGEHKGDWWWNEEVHQKVKVKNGEKHKTMKKEPKLAVMEA